MNKRKRHQYQVECFHRAVSDVRTKKLNTYQAAREYQVPRSTVFDHIKEENKIERTTPGPPRMLTEDEEVSLLNYIKHMGTRGFPVSRKLLKSFVVAIVKESGRKTLFNLENGPSDKWCRQFFKRHPDISERAPEVLDKSRARMSNWTVMNQYFNLLNKTVEDLGLKDKPAQIFNCDESGFSGKEKCRKKVLVGKGTHAYQQSNLGHSHCTAHVCVAADGRVLPTYIIFEGGLPHRNFTDGVPPSWLFGSSASGYMDSELFELWFDNIFLPHCGSRRPVLLIFDNHDSHISLSLLKKAMANDVHVMGLPPHTTHILQPLDVSIFGPLKQKVASLAASVGYVNPNAIIGKAKFPMLLSSAIDHICTPARVKSGFMKCGIYPIDIDAIDKTQILPRDFPDTSNKKQSEDFIENEATPENILCHSCGTSLEIETKRLVATNPLVTQGLIPDSLANILMPPIDQNQNAQKKKSSKIITEARVLTGENVIRLLEEKENKARVLEEEKEKRKIDRIKKREEKERATEEKRLMTEEKRKERERKRQKKMNEKRQRQATKGQRKRENERGEE